MNDFEYFAPATIDEAVALLQGAGSSRVLAGGTDLLVQLREGQRQAERLVDVKRIGELTEISFDLRRGLRIGAAAPCHAICEHGDVLAHYPALADAAQIIGGWQIQSRASLGGNLCNASPAADSIPAMIAYEGLARLAGPGGPRQVPVREFCTAPGRNVLAPGEVLVALEFPPPRQRSGAGYLRFIPRNEMDIAVVGAGAWIELDAAGLDVSAARIALGAVAPTPLTADEAAAWLVGRPATGESFRAAGERAQQIARPISDQRGPAEYRKHLVGVLVARALERAAARARGQVVSILPPGSHA